jgi:RNA polymerase sigma-70 factor (ECF subfamily)
MDTSDHELMQRCGHGDAAAFEVLVRRWEGRVEQLLRRLVNTPSDAEDLKQETFVRVLLASRRYQANGAFSTWLYRIALNLARDMARKHKAIGSLDELEPVDTNGTPESLSERNEQCELVEQALHALPGNLREVLVLRHYGDLTFARIGEVLKEPESTIKSRTKIALKRLYAELRQRGLTNGELE